jgi:TonB family protein
MRRPGVLAAGVLCAGLACLTGDLQSQGAPVSGVVRARSGLALNGAEVSVEGTSLGARTGVDGKFVIGSVAHGRHSIVVRRLGFLPETLRVTVPSVTAEKLEAHLLPVAFALAPVVVQAGRQRHTGRLAGFYERLEARMGGHFITREDLEAGNPRSLTTVLRTVPSVDIYRGSRIRMRGRNCPPMVWLDGVPLGAGEVDIESFPPSSIEAIELYPSCGTILLWSRGPDTEARRRAQLSPDRDIEALLASFAVYTALQVDEEAQAAPGSWSGIIYPPELRYAGVGGTVVVEGVVDTQGRVEAGSFGVVSSPHPLLSKAAEEVFKGAQFRPGLRQGRPVRQLVQQVFRFEPEARED